MNEIGIAAILESFSTNQKLAFVSLYLTILCEMHHTQKMLSVEVRYLISIISAPTHLFSGQAESYTTLRPNTCLPYIYA